MPPGWPASLRLIRHAESVANVDSALARQGGLEMWQTPERDPDVGLTERGTAQARAMGPALGRLLRGSAPVIWSSPFRRVADTVRLCLEAAPSALSAAPVLVDERIRDRDLGILDRLTWAGTVARYPELAELRRRFGKFYFRPPGGESWADVGLRVRSALLDIRYEHEGQDVVVFAHDAVVLMFRYVLERLGEPEILDISRRHPVANARVTTYGRESAGMRLESYNEVLVEE